MMYRGHAEDQHLRADGATGVDELRKQGHKEDERLRIRRLESETSSQRLPVFCLSARDVVSTDAETKRRERQGPRAERQIGSLADLHL